MQRLSKEPNFYLIFRAGVLTFRHLLSIVFVHGLRGQRERTWTKNGVTWPRDILPIDIKDSRILSFGYDSGIVHSDTAEVTQGSIVGDAQSLCALLKGERSSPETVRTIMSITT